MNTVEFILLDTPQSLAAVREIAAVVWPPTFAPILSPEQIEYMMDMMYAPEVMERELASGYRFEIIRIDGRNAGYISYSQYDGHPGTAKLHTVDLLPDFHGQGYGQKMLDHAQEQCRKLGYAFIQLNVNKHNVRAIKAYERNGFETVDAVKVPIGSGFFMDDFVMRKPL